jgi:hypothetical protein
MYSELRGEREEMVGILSFILSKIRSEPTPITDVEIANLIDRFISCDPSLNDWEWDDFISTRQKTQRLEGIRLELLEVELQFPSLEQGRWCSDEGLQRLADISLRLRTGNSDI